MKEYANAMTKKTDIQLVEIIEYQAVKYNNSALEAAQHELNSRNLSHDAINEIRNKLSARYQELDEKEEIKRELKKEIDQTITHSIDALNPTTPKTFHTQIQLIGIFFLFVALYYLFESWEFFSLEYLGWYSLEEILPIFILPVGVFGLMRYQKYGWVILIIFITYQLVSHFTMLLHSLYWMFEYSYENESNSDLLDLIDNDFNPRDFVFRHLGFLCFYGGILWFLNKGKTLKLFQISKDMQLLSILCTAIPLFILWAIVLLS